MSVRNVLDTLFGIIPLLDRIKISIEESSGAIPKASTQLSSVTQATESATVEILNTLDRMAGRIDAAEAGLDCSRTGIWIRIHRCRRRSGSSRRSLAETRQDSMAIAMALQVQDITSQQIAGVTQMIEAVRSQLLDVAGQLDREHERQVAPPPPAAEDISTVTRSTR